jgi:predicted CoA-substrate-specific enzyme activase
MISLGCDIGAVATKSVVMKGKSLAAWDIRPNEGRMIEAAKKSVSDLLQKAGLSMGDMERLGGTGWGEKYMPFDHTTESMISCLARGGHWMGPAASTVLNIGGLSTTIISINPHDGKVIEYRTNDRCASGTGFFLEMAAQALEMRVEDLGAVALSARGRAHISAQCAVFGESEIVTHVNDGAEPADIVSGIVYSIGASVASMARRLSLEREVIVTGGVGKNLGVIQAVEACIGFETMKVPWDPQLVGAIGAALWAQERNNHID